MFCEMSGNLTQKCSRSIPVLMCHNYSLSQGKMSDIYPLNSEYLGHTQGISAKYHSSTLVSVGFILEIFSPACAHLYTNVTEQIGYQLWGVISSVKTLMYTTGH